MTISAWTGPVVSFGTVLNSTNGLTGTSADNNPQNGPSMFANGGALLDPRAAYQYFPGAGISTPVYGFMYGDATVDYAPSSASSNAFAVSSATQPGASSAITLTPSAAKGTFLTTIVAPENGQTVSVIAIDSTAAFLSFGSDANVRVWNPTAGTGRCISITTSSSGDQGSWTIAGRDMYGYKMTEVIATSSVTFTTQKAFKYLNANGAITASSVVTSTGVSVGLSDTYGMPFRVNHAGVVNLLLAMSSGAGGGLLLTTVAPTSGNLVFGSTALTATATTADPRGTWASSLASGSSNRMQIQVTPTAAALASMTSSNMQPLFGYPQFSSV